MKKNILLFFVVIPFLLQYTLSEEGGLDVVLHVSLKNVTSNEGQILVNLYKSKEGFPSDPNKAFESKAIPASQHEVKFNIKTAGEYAVAVCHDENDNSDCDTNFIGIPKERVGVSRNTKGVFGPPKFRDAKLDVKSSDISVDITLSH